MYDGAPGELSPYLDDETLHGYWPRWIPKERQLWALCMNGWHDRPVGPTYRWADENVSIGDYETSHFPWSSLSAKARRSNDLRTVTVELFCGECGRVTRHRPKGWRWASSMTTNQ